MSEQNNSKESNLASSENKETRTSQTLVVCREQEESCKEGTCSLNWKPVRPAA
jgi:hypothetical protein